MHVVLLLLLFHLAHKLLQLLIAPCRTMIAPGPWPLALPDARHRVPTNHASTPLSASAQPTRTPALLLRPVGCALPCPESTEKQSILSIYVVPFFVCLSLAVFNLTASTPL